MVHTPYTQVGKSTVHGGSMQPIVSHGHRYLHEYGDTYGLGGPGRPLVVVMFGGDSVEACKMWMGS